MTSLDEEIAALLHALETAPTLKTIRRAVALKPPRPAPKPKPAPVPRDRTHARLKAHVTRYSRRVGALADARAAIEAARGTKQESWLRFAMIEFEVTEHSDAAALKLAEEDLASYEAKQAPP